MIKKLYIPQKDKQSFNYLKRWYDNIFIELQIPFLTEKEKSFFYDYYFDAGLLLHIKRNYFDHHYINNYLKVVHYLFENENHPVILDLGCGLGTQSLYFAFMGAKVISIDLDELSLSIFQKRVNLYEKLLNKKLDISIHCINSFSFNYSQYQPITSVFSFFAFNLMQPSDQLIQKILPALSNSSRIAIVDGNKSCWRMLLNPNRKINITGHRGNNSRSNLLQIYPKERINVWSPKEMNLFFSSKGFTIHTHQGGISLPPVLWNIYRGKLAESLDKALNHTWFFPVSQLFLAEYLLESFHK